jgi:hypothetical protein
VGHRALFDAEADEGQQEGDQDASDVAGERAEQDADEGMGEGDQGVRRDVPASLAGTGYGGGQRQ